MLRDYTRSGSLWRLALCLVVFAALSAPVQSFAAEQSSGAKWAAAQPLAGVWTVDAKATAAAIAAEMADDESPSASPHTRAMIQTELVTFFSGITVTIDLAQRKYVVVKNTKSDGKKVLEDKTITDVELKDGLIYLRRGGIVREGYRLRPDGTLAGIEMKNGKPSIVCIMRKE